MLQLWVIAGGLLSTGARLTLVCWKCDPIPIPDGEPGEGTGEVFGEGWRFPVISIMSWPMSFSSSSGKGRSNMSSEGQNGEIKFWMSAVWGHLSLQPLLLPQRGTFLLKMHVVKIWKLFYAHDVGKDATCWCIKATEYTMHKTKDRVALLFIDYFIINTIFKWGLSFISRLNLVTLL